MSESPDHVYRGQHWYNDARYAGRPARGSGFPGRAVINTGFRLVVDTDADRVYRGGSWNNSAQFARVAYRYRNVPTDRNNRLGFRLSRDGEDT